MPLYDWDCPTCGKVENVAAGMLERKKTCPVCASLMTRRFSFNVNISPDYEPYMDENLGPEPILVKSRQHRRELMRERGLVAIG